MTFEEFYRDQRLHMERIILAEDLKIEDPPVSKTGKFFIPILTPMATMDSPRDQERVKPVITNMLNAPKVKDYLVSNYIELTIPLYIILEFGYRNRAIQYINHSPDGEIANIKFRPYTITSGSVFLVTGIGGSMRYNDLRIVGIWSKNGIKDDK